VGVPNHDHMYIVPITDPMMTTPSDGSGTARQSRPTGEETIENRATMEPPEANLQTPKKTAIESISTDPGGDLSPSESASDRAAASDHAPSEPASTPSRRDVVTPRHPGRTAPPCRD
jgi:hypothetical protein